MLDRILQRNPLPAADETDNVEPPSTRCQTRKKRKSRSKFIKSYYSNPTLDRSEPRGYSLMRTRRLLMAAIRVWELKNGIHNSY